MNKIKRILKDKETGEFIIDIDYLSDEEVKKYRNGIFTNVKKQGYSTKIPRKLYHVTIEENVESIEENGIKCGVEGCVYLTNKNNIDKAIEIINIYNPNKEIAIYEVSVSTLIKFKLFNNIDGHKIGYMYFQDISKGFKKYYEN